MREAKLTRAIRFAPLEAADLLAIERQPSQRIILGLEAAMGIEEAAVHAAQPVAWSAFAGDRLLACFGILETFPGRQGVGWALLARDIGRHHLPLTRFARERLRDCGLARVEVLTRCGDVEGIAAQFPDWDPWQLAVAAWQAPTPEMRWARRLGLRPAHVLRKFGAASESYMLFERIA